MSKYLVQHINLYENYKFSLLDQFSPEKTLLKLFKKPIKVMCYGNEPCGGIKTKKNSAFTKKNTKKIVC